MFLQDVFGSSSLIRTEDPLTDSLYRRKWHQWLFIDPKKDTPHLSYAIQIHSKRPKKQGDSFHMDCVRRPAPQKGGKHNGRASFPDYVMDGTAMVWSVYKK